MQDSFDPYLDWLAIPPGDRPPHHYDLLGLDRFANDTGAIAHAADVRTAKIRSVRPGEHLRAWSRLLDQLQSAKVCLLDPASKAAYDASIATPPQPQATVKTAFGALPESAAKPISLTSPVAATPEFPKATELADSTDAVEPARNPRPGTPPRSRLLGPVALLVLLVGGLGGAFAYVLRANPDDEAMREDVADRSDVSSADAAEPADAAVSPLPQTVTPAPAETASMDRPIVAEQTADDVLRPPVQSVGQVGQRPAQRPPAGKTGGSAEYARVVKSVRSAMAEQDLETAREMLDVARHHARSAAERDEVERLDIMLNYLGQFWDGVADCVASLGAGEEIVLKDTRVAVVEGSRSELIVKSAGRLRRWRIEHIPKTLVLAIAEKEFTKDPVSKVMLGTFLLVDEHGDPAYARRLWEEASRAGLKQNVDDLLPELKLAPAAGGTSAKLSPPTDPAQLRRAEQSVQAALKNQYAQATTPPKQLALARQLLTRAKTAGDMNARFVMLRDAKDMAIAAGNAAVALDAVDQTAKLYAVDPLKLKADTLQSLGKTARSTSAHRDLAIEGLKLSEQAVNEKQWTAAARFAELALEAARKSRSRPLMQRAFDAGQFIKAQRGG